MKLQVSDQRQGDTCVYCRDTLAAGSEFHLCAGCGATYHRECWGELAGCASLGCEVRPAGVRRRSRNRQAASGTEEGSISFALFSASMVGAFAGGLFGGFDFALWFSHQAGDVSQWGCVSAGALAGAMLMLLACFLDWRLASVTRFDHLAAEERTANRLLTILMGTALSLLLLGLPLSWLHGEAEGPLRVNPGLLISGVIGLLLSGTCAAQLFGNRDPDEAE